MPNPKVGFLLATTPDHWKRYIKWFKDKLRTLNPTANVTVSPPNGADGDPTIIHQTAVDLANNSSVDIIVTAGTLAGVECKTATQMNQKPFVFASVGDAAISGLTPQPGGNFTGGCNGQANVPFVHLRVDYMLSRPMFTGPFAVVGNYNNEPAHTAMDAAVDYLRVKGKSTQIASLTPQDDIGTFISGLKSQNPPIKSLYVCSDLWITVNSKVLNQKAHAAGMKTMFEFEEHKIGHGGDDYHGANFQDMFEKAAEYVDIILRDKTIKAGDLPLYQPSPSAKKNSTKKKSTKKKPTKKKSRRGR